MLDRAFGYVAATLVCLLGVGNARAASPVAVESSRFMVVSAQRLAAEAGAEILRAGGNAIDAAVAMGYAEAVTNPCCGNIGGGGFMVAHLADGRNVFINFRETAPASARKDMFLGADGNVVAGASLRGWRAAGVPGTVLGLDTALTRFGRLPRDKVMAPAIRLARDGFVLTRGDTDIMARFAGVVRRDPVASRVFLRPDGSPFEPGERLIQPDLAATLSAIAAGGPDTFYKGAAAVSVARASGGVLTEADFADYTIAVSEPLSCSYRGYSVVSAPPPSSGGTALCEILGVVEGYDLRGFGFHGAREIHVLTEAMRHAFVDRNSFLGDPAFVRNPVDALLSREHIERIRAHIGERATPSIQVTAGAEPHERPETTHFSAIDREGNAVATTYTINGGYGAGVMAPGTGFLLNNEMDDFTIKAGTANFSGLIQGEFNRIAPGKRPLSSMSPTIVLRDGKVSMVLGSPGGGRIITIVAQAIVNTIDHGMAPQEAIDAPRIHHQWLPDTIFAERHALSPDTKAALVALGYSVTEQTNWGAIAFISVGLGQTKEVGTASSGNDSSSGGTMRAGMFYGAIDSRRPAGAAIGE